MSNKQKALIQTGKFLGIVMVSVAFLLILEMLIGAKLVSLLIACSLVVFFTWILYSVNLSKIEMDEKYNSKKEQK